MSKEKECDHFEKIARRISQKLISMMPMVPQTREQKMTEAIVPILEEELSDDGR